MNLYAASVVLLWTTAMRAVAVPAGRARAGSELAARDALVRPCNPARKGRWRER